jgi:hypothetical protein
MLLSQKRLGLAVHPWRTSLSSDNWYDESLQKLYYDIVEETEVPIEDVQRVYSFLVNFGLIDYDCEKELLWNEYVSEEE